MGLKGKLPATDTGTSFTVGNKAVYIDEIRIYDSALTQDEIEVLISGTNLNLENN